MEFIGQNKEGYWFECKLCYFREVTLDPNLPTTPEEISRPSMKEWNIGSKMSGNIYKSK